MTKKDYPNSAWRHQLHGLHNVAHAIAQNLQCTA